MRPIVHLDLYCGAGGWTTGFEEAMLELGIPFHEIAINHWFRAVETMRANHPGVYAMQMDIDAATPDDIEADVIDHLHASPSCTHHSRAKGGKPRSNQLRSQPNEIWKFVDNKHVRWITIENVPEFAKWGPLTRKGKPIKRMEGSCFRAWLAQFTARGYDYEWRILNCADYGDATSRKRFFLIAVKRGCGKIRWPKPTHAEVPGNGLKRWRGVDECLDYSDIGHSIFGRKNPLALNTLRRVAIGLRKYCGIDFQIDMLGAGENDESRILPLTSKDHFAIVRTFVLGQQGGATLRPDGEPCPTVATGGAIRKVDVAILDMSRPGGHDSGHVRSAKQPLQTLTTCDNVQGVFAVLEDGRLLDVRIRMLKPSELAAAHSFPKDYRLSGSRADQVKQIGNSVPVRTAKAIVKAIFGRAA